MCFPCWCRYPCMSPNARLNKNSEYFICYSTISGDMFLILTWIASTVQLVVFWFLIFFFFWGLEIITMTSQWIQKFIINIHSIWYLISHSILVFHVYHDPLWWPRPGLLYREKEEPQCSFLHVTVTIRRLDAGPGTQP